MDELPLKHVAVLTPTRNGVSSGTRTCIGDLEALGASRLDLAGCNDVALARNVLMTRAMALPEERTLFLLVDDDMRFSAAQAQLICERAMEGDHAVSGVYATSSVALAHTRRPDGLWWSGLGFMAVRREMLSVLADELGRVRGINGQMIVPFCQSRVSPNGERWFSEDYWFCDSIGGVELAPLGITHMKAMPITPDAYTLDRIANPELAEAAEAAEAKAAEEQAAE